MASDEQLRMAATLQDDVSGPLRQLDLVTVGNKVLMARSPSGDQINWLPCPDGIDRILVVSGGAGKAMKCKVTPARPLCSRGGRRIRAHRNRNGRRSSAGKKGQRGLSNATPSPSFGLLFS